MTSPPAVQGSPAALASLASLAIQLAGGTDAVRTRLGQQAALDLVTLAAGQQAAAALAARWSDAAPAGGPRQLSTAGRETYEGDPLHDPRVLAVLGPATGETERREVIEQVTAEYRQRAEGKREQAAEESRAYANQLRAPLASPAMLPGHVTGGNRRDGARWDPVSHTFVGGQAGRDEFWDQFPDHAPGALQRAAVLAPSLGNGHMPLPAELAAPPRPADCSHDASPAGAKFCTQCGQSLDGQQHDQAGPPLPPSRALPPERDPGHWTGEAGALPLPPERPDLPEQGHA